jgi:hypothetical protein
MFHASFAFCDSCFLTFIMSERPSSKDPNVTRRDALKFLGASAAATLAPRVASAAHQKNLSQHADVGVVGAGFAGMIVAKNLVRNGIKSSGIKSSR